MTKEKMEKIREFAEGHFADNKDSAHNMDHVMRVYNVAVKLAEDEKADLDVIKIATLLTILAEKLNIKIRLVKQTTLLRVPS